MTQPCYVGLQGPVMASTHEDAAGKAKHWTPEDGSQRPYPDISESDMPLPAFPSRSRRPSHSVHDMLQLQSHGAAFVLNARLADAMTAPPCMFGRSHVNILACPNFLHGMRGRCRSTLADVISQRPSLLNSRRLSLPAASRPLEPHSAPNFMVLIGRSNRGGAVQATDPAPRLFQRE